MPGERLNQLSHIAARWLNRGLWSIIDQGLFAGANFVMFVLLARFMVPEQYGAFTVAYTVFLLAGTVHTGFLTEPMLVFGAGKSMGDTRAYITALCRGHAAFSLFAGVCLLLTTAVLYAAGSTLIGRTVLVLSAAQAFLLFAWLARRCFYIDLSPARAAAAGAVYAVPMIAGIFLLHSLSLLSSARALAVMSVSSFASGAWVLARLRVNPFMHIGPALKKEALRRHWKYGRWAAATGIIMWVPGQLPYIILSAAAGLETSAALKALRNLAMPAAHTYSALFVLLVPAFVRSRERGTLGRALTVSLAAITGCMMLYWAFLALAGPALTRILYKGQYDGYAGFLWLVGTQPLVASVASVLSAALRALEEPQKVFWAYAAMSAGIVTVGWALIAWSGVSGAIIGYTLCNLIGISVMLYLLSKHRV